MCKQKYIRSALAGEHALYLNRYLIRLQTFDTQHPEQTFMSDTEGSTVCLEAIGGNQGWTEWKNVKRERKKRVVAKAPGGQQQKLRQAKNRDSCASGYQLMSRECPLFYYFLFKNPKPHVMRTRPHKSERRSVEKEGKKQHVMES